MISETGRLRVRAFPAIVFFSVAAIAFTAHFLTAQTPQGEMKALEGSFQRVVKPFFARNCMSCHNSDLGTAGVRVDQLDASLDDAHLKTWEAIHHRVKNG